MHDTFTTKLFYGVPSAKIAKCSCYSLTIFRAERVARHAYTVARHKSEQHRNGPPDTVCALSEQYPTATAIRGVSVPQSA